MISCVSLGRSPQSSQEGFRERPPENGSALPLMDWRALKNALPVMRNRRRFTMHHFRRPNHGRAKGLRHRTVPQTNAQQWDLPCVIANNLQRNTGVIRRTGSRGNDDFCGLSASICASVSSSLRLTRTSAPSSQKYWYRFRERIIVIDKQDHGGSGT